MVSENLKAIRSTLPQDGSVELVAVSKFHPAQAIAQAYEAGQRLFGESRLTELEQKARELTLPGLRWHFIGHLQTNKVRKLLAVSNLALIESVDSERLLRLIDQEAVRAGITIDVLMQLHVAREETKFGFSPEELLAFFEARSHESLQAVHIRGIMAMASNVDDPERWRLDFNRAADTFRAIAARPEIRRFDLLSMGMSHDYPVAMECGANLVRVGTAIFGERTYDEKN